MNLEFRLADGTLVRDKSYGNVGPDVIQWMLEGVRDGPRIIRLQRETHEEHPCWCVPIKRGDGLMQAIRVGQGGLSRFIFNRAEPIPTKFVSAVLLRDRGEIAVYRLHHVYRGQLRKAEYWDKPMLDREYDPERAVLAAKLYWDRNAFVPGGYDLWCSNRRCPHRMIEREVSRNCLFPNGAFCARCRSSRHRHCPR